MSFHTNSFRIKQVETKEEFESSFNLRWHLLRKPWHQTRGSEQDDIEDQCYHLIAIDKEQNVIGIARLQSNSMSEAQIRYMAVATNHQKLGVGRALLDRLEAHAIDLGHGHIMLDARENATGFYTKLGYSTEAKSYLLFGEIQHFRMYKQLTS